ncbi:MAG: peptide ABC transporter substrate-binding protein [Planctomycetales bacterium]|nr:peptide ABC transporter substrate-binding protein [Planctomycetales bacterium]
MSFSPRPPARLLATPPVWIVALVLVVAGCSRSEPVAQPEEEGAAGAESESTDEPFKLGNAVEPFDPPSRDELEQVEWIDRPVIASDASLRAAKEASGPPEITAAEALKMHNDSAEDNRKILGALSQLAPEDGAGVDYDATIVRHVTGDIGSTNPLFASSVTDAELGDLTSFSPLSFDQNLEYFGPAERIVSWQSSADGTMDRIVLRDDLVWSDGKPLTAHDIEFTFRAIMTDHPLLVIPAVRSDVEHLKAVVAYDDQTVVYFHKEPTAVAYKNVLFPVLPKHVYEKTLPEDPSMRRSAAHSDLEDHPVSCGPYELTKRKKGEEFVVRRRESWYMHDGRQVRPKPYFAEVRVKIIEDANTALLALREGDIHSMELRAEQWTSQTNDERFYRLNTKVYGTEWTEFHFVWNQQTPYFKDSRVRWAMTYAFDYNELLNVICRGLYEQSVGTYHPASWMFPHDGPEPVKQDLQRAKALLDEAGWIDSDGDGFRDKEVEFEIKEEVDGETKTRIVRRRIPFEFVLMTYSSESGIQAATLMKECLDRIGVICHVKPTEFAAMQEANLEKSFDACMGGWGAGADPDTNVNIFGTGATRNYGSYSNSEVDRLFVEGRKEFDPEKRAAIYGRIHNLMWEDQPYTWLFYRSGFFAFNKRLRGYNYSPRGPLSYSPGFEAIYATGALP